MPGGVSSPVRSMKSVGGKPLIIERAEGAMIEDIDGTRYIDYCMSFGPLILGHAHQEVVEALLVQVKNGVSYGTSNPMEIELAEEIVTAHPAMDWVRFVNSGTEAVMSAIRLARGTTGRTKIVKFEGTYHGHADSMLVRAGSGLVTFGLSSSAGIPTGVSNDTIVLQLGNEEALKEAFALYGEDIAAVIIEGVPANNGLLIQTKEFMHLIQELCRKHGALFILDELITGFRLGLGGATAHYGLMPDIVTLGKIIGGGLPVGVYGGRAELMNKIAPLGSVYQAGTLSGNPLAMVAGLKTIRILKENPQTYEILERRATYLLGTIRGIMEEAGFPCSSKQIASIVWPFFQEPSEAKRPDQVSAEAVQTYSQVHQLALKNGVYLPPSAFEVSFLSTAHTESVLQETVNAFEKVVSLL